MASPWVSVALIAVLICVGGVFAAAEMALVSLRESQVTALATRGARGRKVAALTRNPNRFLSAVQICVTFTGFLSASVGAAALSGSLAPVFEGWGLTNSVAHAIAVVVVTVVISYFSVVIGELGAKRLAMQRPESIAVTLGGFVDGVAVLARPVVWFLGVSTNVVVRLLGGDPKAGRQSVTAEELRSMVATSSTLTVVERKIVDEVFQAGDRRLREVMVPRTEVDFLAADLSVNQAIAQLKTATHSRYPVTGASVDDVLGFVHIRDLMYLPPAEGTALIRQFVRPVTALPATVKVLHALTNMRRSGAHIAIVSDEYGGVAGIVTLEDLVEELIGEIHDEYDAVSPGVIATTGQVEVDGLTTIEQFEDLTRLVVPDGPYDTIAGYWVAQHGALPAVGDEITVTLRHRGEAEDAEGTPVLLAVTAMDGRRADRISVRRAP